MMRPHKFCEDPEHIEFQCETFTKFVSVYCAMEYLKYWLSTIVWMHTIA